jgi:hypothetical protein
MAKAYQKNSVAAFLSLEAEYTNLCRDEHQTTKAAAKAAEARIAKVQARIEAICDLVDSPTAGFDFVRLRRRSSGERFVSLLRNRWHSSQSAIDYLQERNGLLARLGEVSADKHRRILKENKQVHADFIVNRDRQMAQEFLRKRHSSTSDSACCAEIGKRHNLVRSTSIEAVKRGLKALKA